MPANFSNTSKLDNGIDYRHLFEAARDGILVLDLDTKKILEVNPYLAGVLGRSRDELLGMELAEAGILKDAEAVDIALSAVRRGEEVHCDNASVFAKGGRCVPVDFVAYVYTVGSQPAVRINIRDVSERSRIEEALQIYVKRLEWSNRELQDFAHIASHDLQEPLRAIQVFSEWLSSKYGDELDEKGADYLVRIRDAACRMRSLINDLLEYSRVTSKARPFVKVSLTEVVQAVVSDLYSAIAKVGATVEVGWLPEVEADANQMRQLLQNILSNSLKFHRPDLIPKISIKATPGSRHPNPQCLPSPSDPERATYFQVIVEDNGIGFEQQYADRIFSPFERLHSRRKFSGSGIGLAICRKIVERHLGTISAVSDPSVGTSIHIYLPTRPALGVV
jgi:PAS domain S-box-containing protein